MIKIPHLITAEDLHDVVDALSAALDAKSSYTCGHSERVADLSLQLSRQLRLPKEEQERIHIGAHLHDIGKIGIPDAILNKPGKLTDSEFSQMRKHPVIGCYIISKVRVFKPVNDIVRHHHERFDGRGYPDGLKGDDISIGARIVAVADSFDAMISERPYRLARSLDDVLIEIQKCKGSQFDPQVVAALMELCDEQLFNVELYERTS